MTESKLSLCKIRKLNPQRRHLDLCVVRNTHWLNQNMLNELDKKIIQLIQGDLPLEPRPFAVLSERIGIPEEELVERLKALKEQGVIRRFGATLRHQEAGFSANAMVAWIVPEERIREVGETMAGFREVTHCYQRRPRRAGVKDYALLFSEKEFKKTSMAYF